MPTSTIYTGQAGIHNTQLEILFLLVEGPYVSQRPPTQSASVTLGFCFSSRQELACPTGVVLEIKPRTSCTLDKPSTIQATAFSLTWKSTCPHRMGRNYSHDRDAPMVVPSSLTILAMPHYCLLCAQSLSAGALSEQKVRSFWLPPSHAVARLPGSVVQ